VSDQAANSERALILAPLGRDAVIASGLLAEVGLSSTACDGMAMLLRELDQGVGVVIVTEESVRTGDVRGLAEWVVAQPAWSDLPFILLTERSGGMENNPSARRTMEALGNIAFLERPFHPTTFVSMVQTALRGRRRQYEARARLQELRQSEAYARNAEAQLRTLNETLEARVEERTSELGTANRMLLEQIKERERIEATLSRMQRLEAVGQLTAGIAHDFNNLLTVVLGNVRLMERGLASPRAPEKTVARLAAMRAAGERGAKLTAQLLAFSRRQRLEPKAVIVNEVLDGMHDLMESTLRGSVEIKTAFEPTLWSALVDPTQLELVVLNLVINARDAMPVGGTLVLETKNVKMTQWEGPEGPVPGDYVMVAVTDSGTGMTEDILAKAFEPFFTTKEVGKGSGLGLSQVLGFAKQSGGGIRIDSKLGQGTSVQVFLPRTVESVEKPKDGRVIPADVAPRQAGIVLLVDDDPGVREVTASSLREEGFVVWEAGSGGAALEMLDRLHGEIDLALVDFAMPGMNGAELARQSRSKWPALPVLFITGYADTAALGPIGEDRVIRKPFISEDLVRKIRAAMSEAPHSPKMFH
jgi:signal transduction histidine kinase/CheY-like chemotaxis protein